MYFFHNFDWVTAYFLMHDLKNTPLKLNNLIQFFKEYFTRTEFSAIK